MLLMVITGGSAISAHVIATVYLMQISMYMYLFTEIRHFPFPVIAKHTSFVHAKKLNQSPLK